MCKVTIKVNTTQMPQNSMHLTPDLPMCKETCSTTKYYLTRHSTAPNIDEKSNLHAHLPLLALTRRDEAKR